MPAYVSYTCTEHFGAVCVRLSLYYWQGGEEFFLDSCLVGAVPSLRERHLLSVFISPLFAAFPGIVLLCSKRDSRLVPSALPETQPSVILDSGAQSEATADSESQTAHEI